MRVNRKLARERSGTRSPISGTNASVLVVVEIIFMAVLAAFPGMTSGFLVSIDSFGKRISSSRSFNLFHSSGSNAGKGDDTIKELNKLDSIVIDPLLVTDPAFWDYCLVPNEQGPMRLRVLQSLSNDGDDAASLLVESGASLDDIFFYQETYGVFEEKAVSGPPPGAISGLVARADTLSSLQETSRHFSKVIRVLRDDDCNDASVVDENPNLGAPTVDIEVSSLGELRALTICSYAYLTKRS